MSPDLTSECYVAVRHYERVFVAPRSDVLVMFAGFIRSGSIVESYAKKTCLSNRSFRMDKTDGCPGGRAGRSNWRRNHICREPASVALRPTVRADWNPRQLVRDACEFFAIRCFRHTEEHYSACACRAIGYGGRANRCSICEGAGYGRYLMPEGQNDMRRVGRVTFHGDRRRVVIQRIARERILVGTGNRDAQSMPLANQH